MDKKLKALRKLLGSERAALVSADFGALESLARKRENLLAELDLSHASQDEVQEIRAQFQQVQDMTHAALEGFRAARDGLSRNERIKTSLDSYGPDGAARCIATPTNDLSRRA